MPLRSLPGHRDAGVCMTLRRRPPQIISEPIDNNGLTKRPTAKASRISVGRYGQCETEFATSAADMHLQCSKTPFSARERGESLVKALKREVYEESGLRIQIGSLLGVLDRRDKDAITLLFVAVSNEQSVNVKQTQKEIIKASFQAALPKKASPSAKYFWSARSCQKTAEN